MKPKHIEDRTAFFKVFGKFVNDLGGRYITAMDSGTNIDDMDVIAEVTKYVASHSAINGDPSPQTALGTLRGLEAAIKFKFNKDSFEGLHVAIQGLGAVGIKLAEMLHERGAALTVCDPHEENLTIARNNFDATVVGLEEIYKVSCDIFSPSAFGAVINDDTIPILDTKIIAGCANNQLAQPHHGEALQAKDILYAPDFVINAGGLIYAAGQYNAEDSTQTENRINKIYDTLLTIFERAQIEDKPTSAIADALAAEKLSE